MKQTGKSQHLATLSLAVMVIGFLVTLGLAPSLWVTILQGAFEAGLVGGLADWFAVTALFRHPLGLPIPHTALLPKNREKIIEKIISMLENDLLTKESIKQRISTIHFTEKLFSFFEEEIHNSIVKEKVTSLIQQLIKKADLKKLAPIIEQELKGQIRKVDLKNILPPIIDQIAIRKYDEKALDYILKEVDVWAKKDSTKYKLGGLAVDMIDNIKADGFMQFALRSFSSLVNEEKLGNIIQNLILKGIDSFQNPMNQNRKNLIIHIEQKLQDLKTDEKLYQELEQLKIQLITEWQAEEKIIQILDDLQQKALEFTEHPAFYDQYILPFIANGLNDLKADVKKVNQLEEWIKKHIYDFADKNHSKIGKLVETNLKKWDTNTLISMIETNVGKDLQWIRVNGAVCGFLIGLVLTGIKILI